VKQIFKSHKRNIVSNKSYKTFYVMCMVLVQCTVLETFHMNGNNATGRCKRAPSEPCQFPALQMPLSPSHNVLTYLLTYLLTHSMVQNIIWKVDCHSAHKTISCLLYVTRRFITVLTKARHWTLSWANRIQFAPSSHISLRSILLLPSHLRLGLPSGLLPSGLPTKTL
jgi:hypothetical protein